MKFSLFSLSIASLLFFGAGCSAPVLEQTKNNTMIVDGYHYLFLRQENASIELRLQRPSKEDPEILLAVPGTYSSPQGTVEGLVIQDGVMVQKKERQAWNGAAVFTNGAVTILETNNGKKLSLKKLEEIAATGASLIQGHLLVKDGVPQPLKPQANYQRRALAVFEGGDSAIIESSELIELDLFAKHLATLGVRSAMNLDMGSWSEGWYRKKNGETTTIGYLRDSTDQQTNWVVFLSDGTDRVY